MLITNRRLRTLFITLAGMEAAVLSIYLPLLARVDWIWRGEFALHAMEPLRLLPTLWLILLGMALILDLLGRSRLSEQRYQAAVVLLVLISALIAVRLWIYPERGLFDLGWLGETAQRALNFHRGVDASTFALLLGLFLWLRATSLSGREITFLGVGMGFRLGLLMMLVGAGFLVAGHPALVQNAIFLFATYLGLGLLAVAAARSDEKSEAAAGSAGGDLTLGRFVQLLLMVGLILGPALLIGLLYTPARMRATLALLAPLWRLLEGVFFLILAALFWIVEWIVAWLYALLAPLLADLRLLETLAQFAERFSPNEVESTTPAPTDAAYVDLLMLCLRGMVITAGIMVILGLIYLFLVRRRGRPRGEAGEATAPAGAELNTNALRRGWDRLKRWADLVRQYGLGSQLLDAITVANIYANLTRLARQRGYPRRPAQPPDEYLTILNLAFPHHEAALQRITAAYMRVHYGDQPVGGEELGRLRADYEAVRSEEAEEG